MAWESLVGILSEARTIQAQEDAKIPVVCPYDQVTLKATEDGKLFCPWAGDYTWPDDGRID